MTAFATAMAVPMFPAGNAGWRIAATLKWIRFATLNNAMSAKRFLKPFVRMFPAKFV